jgi:hypothetical protein
MLMIEPSRDDPCERLDALLADLVYPTSDDETVRELRAHAATCPRCRSELASVERVMLGLGELDVLEPAAGSTLNFMKSFAALRRRSEMRLVYAQAALLSLACGVLVAVLCRLNEPVRNMLASPWLQRMLATRPWLAGALAPLLFWIVASVLVAIAAPLLVATRKGRATRAVRSLSRTAFAT